MEECKEKLKEARDVQDKERVALLNSYPRRRPFPAEARMKETLERLRQRVHDIESRMRVREDNKTVALGTSRINYMDPRITVAWCKRV